MTRKAIGIGLAALVAVGIVACKLDLSNSNSNTNIVTIRNEGGQSTPSPNCADTLGLRVTAADVQPSTGARVVTHPTPDPCSCTLIVDGVSQGPAVEGGEVSLASGSHSLQTVAGGCVSNVVAVEVK